MNEICNQIDALYKCYELVDQVQWLEHIIERELGLKHLYDKDGEYRFRTQGSYNGIDWLDTTEGMSAIF